MNSWGRTISSPSFSPSFNFNDPSFWSLSFSSVSSVFFFLGSSEGTAIAEAVGSGIAMMVVSGETRVWTRHCFSAQPQLHLFVHFVASPLLIITCIHTSIIFHELPNAQKFRQIQCYFIVKIKFAVDYFAQLYVKLVSLWRNQYMSSCCKTLQEGSCQTRLCT